MTTTDQSISRKPKGALKAAIGALIGTAIEWYDFYAYGTAAALVFGTIFFPSSDPLVSTMISLGSFAIGFLLRPVGAVIFGYIGDRFSRKTSLVITLMMMGASTTLIGVLPTYQQVGYWAPVMLLILRLIQGLSVGGEWGGAVLLASEAAPVSRKALAASMAQAGAPLGSIASTAMFLLFSDKDVLMTWGWRVPFLVSGVLLVVGLLIRARLDESPEFIEARERADRQRRAKLPLMDSLRFFPWLNVCVFAASFAVSGVYFRNVFALNWAVQTQGIDRQLFLNALLIGAVCQLVLTPIGAVLADKFGVRRMHIVYTAAYLILGPFPLLSLVATGEPRLVWAGVILSYVGHALYYCTLSGYLSTLFPPELRYTGISFGYQLSGSLVSAAVPVLAVRIAGADGSNIFPVSLLYAGVIAVSLGAAILGSRISKVELARYRG